MELGRSVNDGAHTFCLDNGPDEKCYASNGDYNGFGGEQVATNAGPGTGQWLLNAKSTGTYIL